MPKTLTTKAEYRNYFKSVSPYIRFQAVFRKNNIKVLQPNFSSFLSGNDAAVKESDLEEIKMACDELGSELKRLNP